MGYVGYTERGQVNQDERAFSRVPLQYYAGETQGVGPGGAFLGTGSVVTEEGVFDRVPATVQYSTVYSRPTAIRRAPCPSSRRFGANPTAPSLRSETVILEAWPIIVAPWTRGCRTVAGTPTTTHRPPPCRCRSTAPRSSCPGTYDFTPSAQGYLQALYSDYTVSRHLAPADAGILLIPPTNPYVPADLKTLLDGRATPGDPFRFRKRFVAIGPSVSRNERELLQLTSGVTGRVFTDWNYDVYAQWGSNDRTEHQTGNVSISRFQELSFAPDGGQSICGEFNPFRVGAISSDCARYISVNGSHRISVRQTLAEASVNGPLLVLPAGDLRAAFGVFYQGTDFDFKPDDALSKVLPAVPGVIGPRPDVGGFPSAPARQGSQSNTDVYVEALAPIARDARGIHSLDIDVGYRRSDYLHGGTADSYKGEILYRPVQPVLLRGSYEHAVRAPSIDELFYPQLSDQFQVPVPDPCTYSSAARKGPDQAGVEALCLAQGLPATLLPTYDYDLRVANGVTGGNPDLQSEQADTYTVGAVLTSISEQPLLQAPAGLDRLVQHRPPGRDRALGRLFRGRALLRPCL